MHEGTWTIRPCPSGVQRELAGQLNLDVSHVGSQGRNLLWNQQINQTPPNTGSPNNAARPYRGYGNINLRSTSATSSYNSLQVSVIRRFLAGLQLNGNYTLSKAVSDASADRGQPLGGVGSCLGEEEMEQSHVGSPCCFSCSANA